MGVVNKKLFPDKYRAWKDSIWKSIKSLGTPYSYRQTFVGSYKAPFSKIAFLDYITASVTYNSSYNWERGTTIDDLNSGNSVSNQSSWNFDGRFNLEQLYNKSKYLKEVNQRFGNSSSGARRSAANKVKKFERTITLKADTTTVLKHNLRTKKIKVTARATDNKPFTVQTRIVDDNTVEILNKGKRNVRITIVEAKDEKKSFWWNAGQYATRFAMSVRSLSIRYKTTKSLSLPQFIPEIGDVFGQSTHYDVLAPGLDFAFGFTDESYIQKAKDRGWLLCDETQTSPAIFSRTSEFHVEAVIEPLKGLKITLTSNRTDNRTNRIQFMYDDMTTTYGGSFTMTHCAIATALRGCSADNGYQSGTFDKFLDYIPKVADRVQGQYAGTSYPTTGFMRDNPLAGKPFDAKNGGVNEMGSDVLIPAFLAAYTGQKPGKVTLNPFPNLGAMRPNWRISYDGLGRIEKLKKWFKSITLSHAYQCTYSVGSFSSYSDWIAVGENLGYSKSELTQNPYPTSPYNISSVSLTEKFAPLIGLSATMKNNITFNAEYRDSRTLTLNSSAGQVVEALSKSLVIGGGYKIANFNSFLKIGGQQQGVSNDLTLNLDFSLTNSNALIRKIENNNTQATSGSRTLSINFTANYILSKRITLGAYFDHQVNTPLVSSSAYPTTNSSYGISINLSLTK